MANYYLDIETDGLDCVNNNILTIQYQQLDFYTGKPIGELIILKSYETSEKEIIEKFSKMFSKDSRWDFIAHGYNLKFENDFLYSKSIQHKIENPIKLFDFPIIDLHPVGIMMNGGNFKGSGLDKISGKNGGGLCVLGFNEKKMYKEIEAYIIQEAEEFIKLYIWLKNKMPELLKEYKIELIKDKNQKELEI